MTMRKVLDSFALIAYFEDEPGAAEVETLLTQAEKTGVKLLMSVINLGEVWCDIARSYSAQVAEEKLHEVRGMAIEIIDVDWELTYQAAQLKAKAKLAYADCFAAALAMQNNAELISGDPEFKQLASQVKMHWLPQK
ncbi:MAG: type II toxin-antitoxin system VapC family toxin [Chloroflexi bacterium]|nr:type II toxin-antitoxin system VapC family toxin [Chloroflexota bacterium]